LFGREPGVTYEVAISCALAKRLDPTDVPAVGYTTKFNAADGLDLYGEIRDVIAILRPQDRDRPYATAERLAELGVTDLASRIEAHESFADILIA
jgi:hypothetical protein